MGESPEPVEVLYVDDDPDSAATVARALEASEDVVDVSTAQRAERAVEHVANDRCDCILSAYELSETTGLELLSTLRAEHPDVPFILFTAEGSESIASEAISAGVTDYVERTHDPEQYEMLAEEIREVVDRSRAERERRRLQSAVDSALEGISVLTADGHYRYVNEAYADIFGYGPSELVGKHKDVVYPAGHSFDEIHPALDEGGEFRDEGRGLCADGDTVPVEYTVSAIETGGYVCVARTVSERWDREQELERKSSMLDSIFEQIPAHLYIKDREARHVRVSDYFTEHGAVDEDSMDIPAYEEEYILGKTDREINDTDHSKAAYEDDIQVIETGEPIINKEEYVADDDDAWNLTSKVPWREDDGTIRGLIGISRRITEQKETEAELKRQNERLDEFASIVSHDLRNPLQTARGRIEVLKQRCDDDQLDVVQRAHDRMETMIEDVLMLARDGEVVTDTEPVDLSAVVENCWGRIDAPGTDLDVTVDRTIAADRDRLLRLIENLLTNAHEHGGTDTTVTIGGLDDGFYVEDDGSGIDPAERDVVFDAGYSRTERGTGFGLRIVNQIAESHGWSVSATAGDAGGARFEITGVESPSD